MPHEVTIYFRCRWADVHRIQERFHLLPGVTVNGETCHPCIISDEDWPLLKETERRGYITIRHERLINEDDYDKGRITGTEGEGHHRDA